jgi:small subunit ribosomal protein S1
VGDRTQVVILSIDADLRRIALSIKRTQIEPWGVVNDLFHVDQIISGAVTQITQFGAFVRLAEGIEGLIHVSELKGDALQHVRESEPITVRIVRIEPNRRRIGLSLNITPDAPESADSDAS